MNEPMANMALQYGSSIADQGKEVLQKNVCYYFITLQNYQKHKSE